jgi:hypothetical protein
MNILFPYRQKTPIPNFSGKKTSQRHETNKIDTIGTNGKKYKASQEKKTNRKITNEHFLSTEKKINK